MGTNKVQEFIIEGMDCANCATTVEKGVSRLDGVESSKINFTTQRLRISGVASEEAIISRVRELGYDVLDSAEVDQGVDFQPPRFSEFMRARWETRLALIGALLILPGLLLTEILGLEHILIDVASLGALLTAGLPVARSAWQAVRINREININVLMTIATFGAFIIGAYTEAGMAMVLFAIGEALEGYTAQRSRYAIRSLMQVLPQQATQLIDEGDHVHTKLISIDDIQVGDIILVKPGERIPMDGRIVRGESSINQAPITGESRLIPKGTGDAVFASSINGQGTIEIEVTHLSTDNIISRVIKLVTEAQERRAPMQRFVDRFAKVYTPLVTGVAVLVAITPPLLFGEPFLSPDAQTAGWLYRGLALLVVACPCALVISTPVSIISAISNAARHGILIKGGAFIEGLARVNAIAFDKTGTLTHGEHSVIDVDTTRGELASASDQDAISASELIGLASAVEQRSEHPLAKAIVAEAVHRGVMNQYPPAEDVKSVTGEGVYGRVNGQDIFIGSHAYFTKHIPHPELACDKAQEYAELGYTSVMISRDGEYQGMITLADSLRPSSKPAIAKLKKIGVTCLAMLTGDDPETARRIADQAGMQEVYAGLLPEDKVSAVEELQSVHTTVAMVGDGINDAPALVTADVGIAMGGASGGTGQAMETADITLMSEGIRQLPFALELSRAALRTIRTNIALSIGIKIVFLGLVLTGLGTMWMAVLADMGTSLLVTLNGMRLLRKSSEE